MMNPSRLFIQRPVATSLAMLAILLIGLLSYRFLAVAALPEVDYPTIQVVTFYPGASPDVMTSSVTAPLERQFGQMPGLNQMASSSSGGASTITLQFDLAVGLDVAEQEVQAAINAASNLLPSDLPAPPVYNKVNPADTPIMTLAITSPTLPLPKLDDLVDTRLAQKLSQLPGVGLVSIGGGLRPAVRIGVNSRALAANGLSLADVNTAVTSANANQAKGSFDGADTASTVDGNDQLSSADDYRHVVLSFKNGAPLYLSDVADVSDGAENNRLAAWADRHARGDCEYSAPAGRQRYPGGGPDQATTTVAAGNFTRLGQGAGADRPHGDHPRLGHRRAIRVVAVGGAGGDGDLPVSAQLCRPRSFRPWRCRCR